MWASPASAASFTAPAKSWPSTRPTIRPRLRALGVIDLPTIQRYLNFHFSVTIDLFGADVSSNAATFYSSGLKGRYEETKFDDDHLLRDATYPVMQIMDGRIVAGEAPALNALNEKLRDDYIKDTVAGVGRWNRIIQKAGIPFELTVPHKAFNRKIGPLAGLKIAPDGRVISEAEWAAKQREWLATDEDRAFVASLMGRVCRSRSVRQLDIAADARRSTSSRENFEFVRFN